MLGTPVVPAAAVLLCWGWCCVGVGVGAGAGVRGFNEEGGRGGWERARRHLAEFQTLLKSH